MKGLLALYVVRTDSMNRLRTILFPIAFSMTADSMASSVREIAEHFNATITILNAFNALPEYFQGPLTDDRCCSKEEPSLPYSAALLELRDLQKERLETFSQNHFSGVRYSVRIEDGDPTERHLWLLRRHRCIVTFQSPLGGDQIAEREVWYAKGEKSRT